ncbi:MAG: hypothetical protein ABW092_00955 [Candidatus Thiodiazotropha sp.]
MTRQSPFKIAHQDLTEAELLASPVDVLNGVSPSMVSALAKINVKRVFDLATAPLFDHARRIANPSQIEAGWRQQNLFPTQLLDASIQRDPSLNSDNLARLPLTALKGIGESVAGQLQLALGIETIADLAAWPPYLSALRIAGLEEESDRYSADPGIPDELVPKLNEHASEKSFYSIYAIDPSAEERLPELKNEIDLTAEVDPRPETPRTGTILRYEQSWTPVALSLGNLLHSLALAPGESTRIAMVDWSRRQGVRTTEDISQLESLANSMVQNRSINEVTRAIAREAQQGFSNMNANSTVSNSAYTSYGMQNSDEIVDATVAGAMLGAGTGVAGGGAVGSGIGGVAGAIIGGVALSETVIGIPGGIAAGGAIGAVGGGLIGAGTGGLIGGTAGGAAGFLSSAQYGSSIDSGSNTTLEMVTSTSSTGERDVESEMMQNIADRTHQHSSSSRNRRAAIVQEVSQSESEKVTTRVVTNYNHMHALTIHYFEVVQQYAVRTTLVSRQPCLYVPVKPIERWTAKLVNRFHKEILSVALTPELVHSLLGAAGKVTLHSPSYPRIPAEKLDKADRTLLSKARHLIDDFISNDPLNGWRLPDSLVLNWVFGIREAGGGGPFGGLGGPNARELEHSLIAVFHSGEEIELTLGELNDKGLRINDIARIQYVVRVKPSIDRELEEEIPEPVYGKMRFIFRLTEGSWENDPNNNIEFVAHYLYTHKDMRDGKLVIPILDFSHSMSMAKVFAHLNANSTHYSMRVLRSRRNPLLRQILSNYSWQGKPLLDVVDQEPIAITGNSLVFLLREAAGSGRESSTRQPSDGSVTSEDIIPIGTGGVFAEAVQGRANAAERLEIGRFWDWQDSPIPIVAPEIAPVALGSRAMSADVRPGSLDPALAQLTASQGMPDPQGSVAALSAVSKEMFRDMSGIAETARVAQSSLQEAMSGAIASGDAASDNLQAGMEQTHAVLEQVIDMNEKFANLLAEQGFGLLTDTAKGAMGAALGGGAAGMGGGLGSTASTVAMGAGRAGSGTANRSGGNLAQRNASIAGAILNRAAKQPRTTAGSGNITPPVSGGADLSPPASLPPPTDLGDGNGSPTNDMESRILGELSGLPPITTPPGAGAAPASSNTGYDVNDTTDKVIRDHLLPMLAGAEESDQAFFQALHTTLDLMAEYQSRGLDDRPIRIAALTKLDPAWHAAVDRAVNDFNSGDSGAIHRLEQLIAVKQNWAELAGGTTIASVMARLQVSVTIGDITTPPKVEGGETVVVGARVTMKMPDGSTRPAEGAPVSLWALPSVEEYLSATADAEGRVSFSFRHGLPDPDFQGADRFKGFLDLTLHLSATAPFSALVSDNVKYMVPGAIAIVLESAYFEDDGSNALFGSVVTAPVGRTVILRFRATKAGQALPSTAITRLELNGTGTADTTDTDGEGRFTVTYLATSDATSVAYLSPVIEPEGEEGAAAMASINIV